MIGKINKMLRNRKGFTLIELVVVIAILGILAAIAVPRLQGFRQTAQNAADDQTALVIERAAELLFASNNGDFPAAVAANAFLSNAAAALGDDIDSADAETVVAALIGANMLTNADVAGLTAVTMAWNNGDATVTITR